LRRSNLRLHGSLLDRTRLRGGSLCLLLSLKLFHLLLTSHPWRNALLLLWSRLRRGLLRQRRQGEAK
jgi:hypothetical protein